MAVQSVRPHKRGKRGVKGYVRKKRLATSKIVRRINLGTYRILVPVDKYGQHRGTIWKRVR